MLNFQLLPGDKYDGRCAEIYITEKQYLIYHCSVCEEIYATFNELLSHITQEHYENTQEFKKANNVQASVAISNEDNEENQLPVVNEGNLLINSAAKVDNKTTMVATEPAEKVNNNTDNFDLTQKENLAAPLTFNVTSPQRKKPRFVTGMLKNSAVARTKLNSLQRYQLNSLEERKYVCGICGFAFKEKYNLRGHLLRHSNQKNFPCSICPKKLFTKVELRLHEYRHKGERPYLCNECGMGFVSNGSLTQHIKKHHSNLPHAYKCEHCDKTFAQFHQLREHQVVHLEERNFTCSECPLDFKCQKNLNSHLKLHENKRKYRCETCDMGFTSEISLTGHQNKIHGIKNEDESTIEVVIERQQVKVEDKLDGNDDSLAEFIIEEGVLAVEQNFDEYELVQTLTDLECNKNV